jgi:hypothetical protein
MFHRCFEKVYIRRVREPLYMHMVMVGDGDGGGDSMALVVRHCVLGSSHVHWPCAEGQTRRLPPRPRESDQPLPK